MALACAERDIAYLAYSPFGGPARHVARSSARGRQAAWRIRAPRPAGVAPPAVTEHRAARRGQQARLHPRFGGPARTHRQDSKTCAPRNPRHVQLIACPKSPSVMPATQGGIQCHTHPVNRAPGLLGAASSAPRAPPRRCPRFPGCAHQVPLASRAATRSSSWWSTWPSSCEVTSAQPGTWPCQRW